MARIENWTKLSPENLWRSWLARFPNEDEAQAQAQAQAQAIFIANRLIKQGHISQSTRRTFYTIKDLFIARNQANLVEGRRVRVEKADCWDCDGQGCERCHYTGVYRERTLYVHRFEIAGQPYSFHSYIKPDKLSDDPGEDLTSYGAPFTTEEAAELPLPISGLMRILRWVAGSKWGRQGGTGEARVHTPRDRWVEKWEQWHSGRATWVGGLKGVQQEG